MSDEINGVRGELRDMMKTGGDEDLRKFVQLLETVAKNVMEHNERNAEAVNKLVQQLRVHIEAFDKHVMDESVKAAESSGRRYISVLFFTFFTAIVGPLVLGIYSEMKSVRGELLTLNSSYAVTASEVKVLKATVNNRGKNNNQ